MLSLFYADTAIERLLCKTDGKTTIFVENETGGWFKFDPWFNTRWDNLPILMRFASNTDLAEWMIWLDSVPIDTDCASRFKNSINRFFRKLTLFHNLTTWIWTGSESRLFALFLHSLERNSILEMRKEIEMKHGKSVKWRYFQFFRSLSHKTRPLRKRPIFSNRPSLEFALPVARVYCQSLSGAVLNPILVRKSTT